MITIRRIQARRLRVYSLWRMTRNHRLWSWLLILDVAYHAAIRRDAPR